MTSSKGNQQNHRVVVFRSTGYDVNVQKFNETVVRNAKKLQEIHQEQINYASQADILVPKKKVIDQAALPL